MQPSLSILQRATIINAMSAVSSLGQFVRERRSARGITARDLAMTVGIEPSMLSRLETGTMKTFPEPWLIHAISRELQIAPDMMMEAAGYLESSPAGDPEHIRELMGLLRRIDWTPERLRFVQNVLRDLAGREPAS